MSWSQQFKNALEAPSKSISYMLRFFSSSLDYSGSGQIFSISGEVHLANVEVVIDNARITPSRWSLNFGGFSIRINGDLRKYNHSFRRGQIAELYMIRNGIPERVTMGQLRAVSGNRGVWTLEFADLISTMDSRLSLVALQGQFFYNAGLETTVTTNFNFSSDPNLYVANINIFEKENGEDGLIHCYDSQHNVTMYFSWSSKTSTVGSAGYLTISAVNVYPSESAHEHLQTGDRIVSLAWLQNRIDYVFAKMLMSTGVTGAAGTFDVYPKSWSLGYAFIPELIDKLDMDQFYALWKPSGYDHSVNIILEEPSNARTLIDKALDLGLFPVFRQGKISWRGSVRPEDVTYLRLAGRITDLDIYSIDSHQFYSQSQPVYYSRSRIDYYDSSSSTIRTETQNRTISRYLPSAREIVRDNSLIYAELNQDQMASRDLQRIYLFDVYPYEELVLTVSERYASLCAGDVVEVTSNYLYGINETSDQRYNSKRALILGVRWLPHQSRCVLSLAVISQPVI